MSGQVRSFATCYSLTEVYRLLQLGFPMEEYRLQFQETINIINKIPYNISSTATSLDIFFGLTNPRP